MSTVSTDLVTIEEFEQLPLERVELVRGVVVERPFEGAVHGRVCSEVSARVASWAWDDDEFIAACGNPGVIIGHDPDSVRAPDVLVVRRSSLPGRTVPVGWLTTPPEMIAEVVSELDDDTEVLERISDYLTFGAAEVWIVNPGDRSVSVHVQTNETTIFTADDTLTSSALPGFTTPVAEFFRGL